MWAIVMINAGLDHACSNHECLEGTLPGPCRRTINALVIVVNENYVSI